MDRRGQPVPDALVAIVDSTVAIPEIALVSDAGGRFHVQLPAGHFTLRAHGSSGTGQTEIDTGRADDPIVIVIDG